MVSSNLKYKRDFENGQGLDNTNPKKQKTTDKVFELSKAKSLRLNTALSTIYYTHYEFDIETLEDIISLGSFYNSKDYDKTKHTNIPFYIIRNLKKPIESLISMVGLVELKKQIVEMIVFYVQKLDVGNHDMLHTVIYGGPGVGKTKFIHILADIYANLGVLPDRKVTFLKRADLIGEYLGHTAIKTKKAIEAAKGGVLVIDEAYSLGDTEQRDAFSRECIDTLNQFLSEEKKDLVCVIAGYKDDLEKRFFKTNPGLQRRFPFKFTILDYTPTQLEHIFCSIVTENGWRISENTIDTKLLSEFKDHFVFNGGDMELLFTKAKFAHARRVFSSHKKHKKLLTKLDFETALKDFVQANPKKEANMCLSTLYM